MEEEVLVGPVGLQGVGGLEVLVGPVGLQGVVGGSGRSSRTTGWRRF